MCKSKKFYATKENNFFIFKEMITIICKYFLILYIKIMYQDILYDRKYFYENWNL